MSRDRSDGGAARVLPTLSRFSHPVGVLRATPNGERSTLRVLRPFAGTLGLGTGIGRRLPPRLVVVSRRLHGDSTSPGDVSPETDAGQRRPVAPSAADSTDETGSAEAVRFVEILRDYGPDRVAGAEGTNGADRVPATPTVLTRTTLVGRTGERGGPRPSSDEPTDPERGSGRDERVRPPDRRGERRSAPGESDRRPQTASVPRPTRTTPVTVTRPEWPPESTNRRQRPTRSDSPGASSRETGPTVHRPAPSTASERRGPITGRAGGPGDVDDRPPGDRSGPEMRFRGGFADPKRDGSPDDRSHAPLPSDAADRPSTGVTTAPTLVVRASPVGVRRSDGRAADTVGKPSSRSELPVSAADAPAGGTVSPPRVPGAGSDPLAGPSLADLPHEDVDRFVDRVYREIEHRQRVERQRLGL